MEVNHYYFSQKKHVTMLRGQLRAWCSKLLRPKGLAKLADSAILARPIYLKNKECIEIGERVIIRESSLLQPITSYLGQVFSPRIVIHDDCYIGPMCQFHSSERIEIGCGSVLSDRVYVSDVGHGLDPRKGMIMDQPVSSKGPVILKSHCFVGYGAVILSGVTIGEHSVVGASSIVTRSVDDFTMVAGNPARVIARYNLEREVWERVHGVELA